MIRVCCRCLKIMGEKEPFEDKRETHGYCDECFKIELAAIQAAMENRRGEPGGQRAEK